MSFPPQTRIQAVKEALRTGDIKGSARAFGVSPKTLRRWLGWHQEGEEKNLTRRRPYRKPWNRASPEVERRVVLLKEGKPYLTQSEAQWILRTEGVTLSSKGIWGIWKRHGFTGFVRDQATIDIATAIPSNPMIQAELKKAELHLQRGEVERAAEVVNRLPAFPQSELLAKIPDEHLTLPRQVDKLPILFGKIPFRDYLKRCRSLKQKCERKEFHFSALRIGIRELVAWQWLGKNEQVLALMAPLKEKSKGIALSAIRITLLMLEGMAQASLLRVATARKLLSRCRQLVRRHPTASFLSSLASFYAALGYHRKARPFLLRALRQAALEEKGNIYLALAANHDIAGEHHAALTFLKSAEEERKGYHAQAMLVRAHALFGRGEVEAANQMANAIFRETKQEGLRNFLFASVLLQAAIHASLGEKGKAKILLRKFSPFLKTRGLEKDFLFCSILLGMPAIPEEAHGHPAIRLAWQLRRTQESGKTTDYRHAFALASRQNLMGLFHQIVFMFPKPVLVLLEKGKPTGLPRSLLRLPVFSNAVPHYSVELLGPLRVTKNEHPLQALLIPKDAAFLVHLALAERKRLSVDSLCENFWPENPRSREYLAHLLVRIRNALKLPSHLLYIKEGSLYCEAHFTTDWGYFEEILAHAKALEREGEYRFAEREYLRAFALIRGKPFEKMYDNWSDERMVQIINVMEKEGLRFAREALGRKDMASARKALQALLRMDPSLKKARELLTSSAP